MFAGATSRLKDIPRGVWALGLAKLRGTAFGVFNLASGAALLLASVAAGLAVSKRLAVPTV